MAQNVKELKLISLLKSKVRLVFFKGCKEKKSIGLRTCKHSRHGFELLTIVFAFFFF